MVGPKHPLPTAAEFEDSERYIESLLGFVASSDLLRTLCGGVHVLDFFTKTPDLYSLVLPQAWRTFFKAHDIMDILDLFMREDLSLFKLDHETQWRGGPLPPDHLLQYIDDIRRLSLARDFVPISRDSSGEKSQKLARHVAVGMKVKKIHEVDNFARYVEKLTADIADSRKQEITHLVDFGSGQNYLGRALASEPYNKHIIAVESRQHNIDGARNWDVMAKLAPKEKIMRNKKEWRAQLQSQPVKTAPIREPKQDKKGERGFFARDKTPPPEPTGLATLQISSQGVGSIQYVEHYIKDGDLSRVVDQIVDQDAVREKVSSSLADAEEESGSAFVQGSLNVEDNIRATDPRLMVISLHSCGNLVHHGIRSLLLNPAVSAVALIGCCYNLITERLGPPTYKLPSLRSNNARLEETSKAFDPHGFPMSDRLCRYGTAEGTGVRLNITARMMAVQAPQNWGRKDSEGFFARHYYRALLQKMFLDYGIVEAPENEHVETYDGSPLGWSGGTAPIIIGSLKKSCYDSFVTYVRGALDKLVDDPERGSLFRGRMGSITDEQILAYDTDNAERKKELSVIWSLMAFSAGVIEAVIVVDRWLFLKEQDEVEEAWVEPVFDFKQSPRNLVVVGIKR
ncbi:hypothetical protein MBLNU459_g3379t1 [Dothideomycetes sp. NU459]